MTIPNQAPDSSVPGYLQGGPLTELPTQTPVGQPLEDYLQQFVAGVACMDGTLVRPRWQPEPANLPDLATDWASVGVVQRRPIGLYAVVRWHPEGEGQEELERQEEFDLLASFYGPHASEYASNLRDGLSIWQNYSVLRLAGMALVETSDMTSSPELIKQTWVNRVDVEVTIRRQIRRLYNVLSLKSAQAKVITENYSVQVSVDPPAGP